MWPIQKNTKYKKIQFIVCPPRARLDLLLFSLSWQIGLIMQLIQRSSLVHVHVCSEPLASNYVYGLISSRQYGHIMLGAGQHLWATVQFKQQTNLLGIWDARHNKKYSVQQQNNLVFIESKYICIQVWERDRILLYIFVYKYIDCFSFRTWSQLWSHLCQENLLGT